MSTAKTKGVIARRGLATLFTVAMGLLVASVQPALVSCGGCDFEGECMAKVGRNQNDLGLLCNYLGLRITLNDDVSVSWGDNPGDELPYERCSCDVVGGTLKNCRYTSSDDCDTFTDCDSCARASYCGWCNGACTIVYGRDDTTGCADGPLACPAK